MSVIAACSVEHFYAWSSHAGQPLPALEQLQAMQRRRLSPLAKTAFSVAIYSLDALRLEAQSVDYMVWASRFGDEEKTLSILKDICTGQTPSPTAFSTSVHNAIAGLYSILMNDATPSTSLSAGEETFSQAFIEASSLLQGGLAKRVLLVYYDQALPDLYAQVFNDQQPSLALALILAVNKQPNLKLSLAESVQAASSHEALSFQQFWQSDTQHSHRHGRYLWEKQ